MEIARIHEILPSVIDALVDSVVVIDRDQSVVARNRRYREAFGGVRVDLVGSACTETHHAPQSRSGGVRRCAVCEVLETRAPQRSLRQLHDSSGAMRRYEASFSPIFGPDQGVTHVVGVWRDITDRRQLEVQLSHSERLASVGVLAAGVAHEINNPLASIMAGLEGLDRWLERGDFGPEALAEAEETIALLEHEIERCRETTRKLALLGRSYDAVAGWVDLNQAVRDTLALLRYELRTRNIEAIEELDSALPAIWAREAAMRGLCMNLMLNAVQAMSEGGRLTVATCHASERVTLAVQDTGTGIAPEHLERIWEPFFTTKPVGQGTGLGLSITNGIVTRHGGRITVESTVGQGTRFVVELPVRGNGGDA